MDSIFGGMNRINEEWEEAAREEVSKEEASRKDEKADMEDYESEGFGCLRCGTPMNYLKKGKIQLGEQGGFGGTFNHLVSGSLSVHIFMCPFCGKYEFFDPYVFEYVGDEDVPDEEEHIAQIECPQCGKSHDMDYPKCPYCNYDYREY